MTKLKKTVLLVEFIFLFSIFSPALPINADGAYSSGYEIIVDNQQKGNGFSCTAGFKETENNDSYGGTSHIVNAAAVNAEKAKWTPTIPVNGYYRVYMTWTKLSDAASSVGVQVHYGNGYDYNARKINQNINSDCWVYIGTYFMPEGTNSYVALKPDMNGCVSADAVKFVLSQPISDGIEASEMENISSGITYNENETVIAQKKDSGEFFLSVDGMPYYINGVCKNEGMDKIRAAGGNTVRTYSSIIANNTTKNILDTAQSLGIKVVLGLSVPKESDTFNYTDNYDDFINGTAFENLKKQINEFKNHPALLMWAVGNEVDILKNNEAPSDIDRAFNEIAKYIKSVDPYHPTTTVHAGASSKKITGIKNYAPCIDAVSVNVYHGIESTYNIIINSAQWQGPYMITEYSTDQPSEVIKYNSATNVVFDDVVIEKTAYEKANDYFNRYKNCILANKAKCLGSFAFASYDTYRGTHTWYNIFLDDNYCTTPAYDSLSYAWTGVEREKKAPDVCNITLGGKTADYGIIAKSGESTILNFDVDNVNTQYTYKFELRKNDMNNDFAPIESVSFKQDKDNLQKVIVSHLPEIEGIYRIYIYVYDTYGNVGYGNIPFKVSSDNEEINVCGANTVAREYFTGISGINSSYTFPTSNGFGGTWKTDKALTSDSNMTILKKSGYNLAVSTPNDPTRNIFNTLVNPINMSSDNVYYCKWVQGYNAANTENSYVKVGFSNTDGSKEISNLFMFRTTDTVPVIGIKAGKTISYSDININRNSLYNVYMKIQAKSSADDMIYVKAWPINTQEPAEWTYSTSMSIDGNLEKIFFQANSSNGSRAYFGGFSLERYNNSEGKLIDDAYTAVKQYIDGTEEAVSKENFPIDSGIVYASLSDIMNVKDKVYIRDIALEASGKRIDSLSSSNENVSVAITFENDGIDTNVFNDNVYVCVYNYLNELKYIKILNSDITVQDKKDILFSLNSLNSEDYIKIFAWNDSQQIVQKTNLINSEGIINY